MRIVAIAAICLAVAACSKPTGEKAAQDLKDVGSEVGSAAKKVASAPATKALGADFKRGAVELAAGVKGAAHAAGSTVESVAKDSGDKR